MGWLNKLNNFLGGKVFLLLLFLGIFLMVSVFGSLGDPGFSGIQLDNYYSGNGNQGIDQNISFDDHENVQHLFTFEDGLLVNYTSQSTLLNGLISYYKLDETSGTTAEDEKGNYNGTANNERVFTSEESGIINTCSDFTQGTDKIDINAIEPDNISISILVYPNSLGAGTGLNTIIEQGRNESEDGTYIIRSDDGNIGFKIQDSGGANWLETGYGELTTGSWYHIVVTYDGTTMRIYKNGNEVTSGTDSSGNINYQTSLDLRIGLRSRNDDREWDGLIDEVGIWNRALTSTEVSGLYNSGSGLSYPFA